MAYSNTNRDKKQPKWWQKVKLVMFYGLVAYTISSSSLNIYRQWSTIRLANERLERLEREAKEEEAERKKFLSLNEEASKSGEYDRLKRVYFGVGSQNDYWLVLPTGSVEPNNETVATEDAPTVLKWWRLFWGRK